MVLYDGRQPGLRVRKLRRTRADIWVLRRGLSAHRRPYSY